MRWTLGKTSPSSSKTTSTTSTPRKKQLFSFGDPIAKKYGLSQKCIGSGTTCKVYLHENKHGHLFAVKSFVKKNLRDEDEIKAIDREVDIHKRVNDGYHVVKFFEEIKTKNEYYVVLEYLPVSLLKVYSSFRSIIPQRERLCYFKQIVRCVGYLESQNIGHRDLKLDNFCIDFQGNVKIIDFGSATIGTVGYGMAGSPFYAAPEIHSSIKYDSFKCNMWSVGVILINLFYLSRQKWDISRHDDAVFTAFQQHPRIENCVSNLNRLDTSNEEFLREKTHVDTTIFRLLETDVSKRLTIKELLNSDWFSALECCRDHNEVQHGHVSFVESLCSV